MRTTDVTENLLEGKRLAESEKAVKFRVDTINGEEYTGDSRGEKVEWFPFSQVTRSETSPAGSKDLDKLWVKSWILQQKGLL
jgi:hypothetical protein